MTSVKAGRTLNPTARRHDDLVTAAMTSHLSVSLGRRLSLDELNENSQHDLIDSPQNGDVDVVTVGNSPSDDLGLPHQSDNRCPLDRPISSPRCRSTTGSPASAVHQPTPPSSLPEQAEVVSRNRRFEACILNRAKVWLPLEIVEEPGIFHEVVSMETWNNVLSDQDRERLSKMMPTFENEDDTQETLRRLFGGENFKFGNPVKKLQKDLKAGYLCLDAFGHMRALRQARLREYRHKQELRCHRLLKEIIISRQELLEAAQFTAPDEPFRVKRPRPLPLRNDIDEVVTKKYRKILKECRIECGELYTSDEDDCPPVLKEKTPTKRRSTSSGGSWYEAPGNIDLPAFTPRVQSTFDHKPISGVYSDPEEGSPGGNPSPTTPDSPLRLSESAYMDMIEKHQCRRENGLDHFEMDTRSVTLEDIMTRTFTPQNSPTVPSRDIHHSKLLSQKRKGKVKDKLAKRHGRKERPPKSTTPVSVASAESRASQATPSLGSPAESPSTNQEERSTPVDGPKDEDEEEEVVDIQSSLRSTLYPNFFSFLRDVVKRAPDGHLTAVDVQSQTEAWQQEPLSALNVWFTLAPSWPRAIGSMLRFLIGELPCMPIQSPMVEYREATQTWAWTGGGRDSDEQLTILFKQWLTAVMEEKPTPPETERQASPTVPSPIKIRTDFVVRPTTTEEKAVFRAQEHDRYEQPHKAFTYRIHGYDSVVGPVKGVYGKEATLNKAREHSLLVSDRPPYVTILSLVRDAAARLPNGEGTRSEVCELLKDSRFLVDATDNQINTVVSGALDRLHYERDPCVKYDGNRKLWIYLHRNRTEDEFERIHLQQAVSLKAKRSLQKQPKPAQKTRSVIKDMPLFHLLNRPPSAMSDTSNDSIISVGVSVETSSSTTRSPGHASISPHSLSRSPAASRNPASATTGGSVTPVATHNPPAATSPVSVATISKTLPHISTSLGFQPPSVIPQLTGNHPASAYSSQVQALLTHAAMPSILVPTSVCGDMNPSPFSVNSLIKAQLLAPRRYVALSGQQLGAVAPPFTSQKASPKKAPRSSPYHSGHNVKSPPQQQLQLPSTSHPPTLTLPGAREFQSKTPPPSSAVSAAMAFAGARCASKPGCLPLSNVKLTTKGTGDETKATSPRCHGGKTKLPTVGGLLAGLGVPLEAISSPRASSKKSTKSKSPPRSSSGSARLSSPPASLPPQVTSVRKRPPPQRQGVPAEVSSFQDRFLSFQTMTSPSLSDKSVMTPQLILGTSSGSLHPTASGLVFQHPQLPTINPPARPQPSSTPAENRRIASPTSQRKLKDMSSSSSPDVRASLLTHSGSQRGGVEPAPQTPGSFPKGTIPVMSNTFLSAGLPGKGVIFQVSIGSKLVSTIPATATTTSVSLHQQRSAPVVMTPSTPSSSSLMTPLVFEGGRQAKMSTTEEEEEEETRTKTWEEEARQKVEDKK